MSIRPPFGRELDCIAQQVVQDLLKTDTVGENGRAGFQVLLNPDVLRHGQRANRGEDFRKGFRNVKILTVKFELVPPRSWRDPECR